MLCYNALVQGIERKSCLICAWRENCQKRWSVSPEFALRCPDYVKDVKIKEENSAPSKK